MLPVGRRQCTLAALIMLVPLAACVSERDALIEQGFAPAYAEGYDDGCASGSAAAGGLFDEPRKDAGRYATDTQYTQGWDTGFAKCQRATAAMVRDARLVKAVEIWAGPNPADLVVTRSLGTLIGSSPESHPTRHPCPQSRPPASRR